MRIHPAQQTASNMILQMPCVFICPSAGAKSSFCSCDVISVLDTGQDGRSEGSGWMGLAWHGMTLCDFMPLLLELALTYSLGTRASMRGRDGKAGSSVVIAGTARIIETGKSARLLCGIIRHGGGTTSCPTLPREFAAKADGNVGPLGVCGASIWLHTHTAEQLRLRDQSHEPPTVSDILPLAS